MTDAQRTALVNLCERYGVPFDPSHFTTGAAWDLPPGYVAGWVGGPDVQKLYVGCSPEGHISS